MRPLEITLLVVNVPLLLWCMSGRALPLWGRGLSLVALLVTLAHLLVEGARWHLIPAYAVTVGLVAASCWPHAIALGRVAGAMGILLLIGSGIVATVLPVFTLPQPTGEYPIGTAILHLIDTARTETLGDGAGRPRELMIQVWYPAAHAGPPRVYRPHDETELKKRHLSLVRTHSALGVPIAEAHAQYPVVIFAPSWTGRRDQNTVQVEELASHGFVVVGIDHPYSTALTVFPDGRRVETVLGDWMDFSTEESFQRCVHTSEAQLQIRAADVRFVLGELERLNVADPQGLLTSRLDLTRLGIFGHSFGGAVSAEMCATDLRFKAGVNLDGTFFGAPKTKPLGRPFMVFAEDAPVPTEEQIAASTGRLRRELIFNFEDDRCIRQRLAESGGYIVTLRGAAHMDFCDSPFYSPIRRLTHCGPIAPRRGMEIINACVVAFFQTQLHGAGESLVERTSSRFPEALVERFPGDVHAPNPRLDLAKEPA